MSQPYIGEVRMFPFDWPPRHWALCAGQLMSIQQNQALFSLLGTTYGGNGMSTFGLPDLRGRAPMSSGQLPGGQNYIEGESAGTEQVSLINAQMPMHNHMFMANTTNGDTALPSGNFLAAAHQGPTSISTYAAAGTGSLVSLAPDSLGIAGGSQPHPNMQPYLVMNYSIALYGVFPSRN